MLTLRRSPACHVSRLGPARKYAVTTLPIHDPASAEEAVARARAGKGPTLIECKTYRQHGHFEGDPGTYKPKEEQAAWMAKDPMPRYA